MKLLRFVSCWGNEVDIAAALPLMNEWHVEGVEGPPPDDAGAEALKEARLQGTPYIAEVVTGGGYIPAPHLSVEHHLDDLKRLAEASLPYSPLFINALAGRDGWPFREQIRFFETAIHIGWDLGVEIAFETHRSRPTFNPWRTRDLLAELPDMRLTCDFSHWCAVCERLVMNEEPELLDLFAGRARHVHARVGYDQGPQVADPRAPENAATLESHLRWWRRIFDLQEAQGRASMTVTPEFGPDGYLHCEPFTRRPVADLHILNRWMGEEVMGLVSREVPVAA